MSTRFLILFIVGFFFPSQIQARPGAIDTYTAVVSLLPCNVGSQGSVTASAAEWLEEAKLPVKISAVSSVGAVRTVTMTLPRDHRDVWFHSGSCEAKIVSMSVGEAERHYIALLVPGIAGDFEERDAFIAGSLPLAGVQRVELVPKDLNATGYVPFEGVIDGQSYYFESPPAGEFRIRLVLGRFRPTYTSAPIRTYNLNSERFALVRDFTIEEVLGSLDRR